MKNAAKLCSVLFCSVLLLTSCSNFMSSDEDGSILTLSFNGSDLSGARDVTPEVSDTESYWITVAISGDYTDSKTVKVDSSPTTYQMVYDDIPVGATITIKANVFNQYNVNTLGYHKYTGSKSDVVVQSGQNDVSIAMTKIKAGDGYANPELKKGAISIYADAGTESHTLNLYSTGKYVLVNTIGGSEVTVSEGLYEGDIYSEGTRTIYFTEYVYADYTTNAFGQGTQAAATYIENPQPVPVTYGVSTGSVIRFDFTSAKGVRYHRD